MYKLINVTALASATGSAQYLTQDNYYLKEDKNTTQFFGNGAKNLGLLDQKVTTQNIKNLLSGVLPSGQQIGRSKKHRAGWDLTLSAPKSVSIQALVVGDNKVLEAHDSAVKIALNHYQEHLTTRQRNNGSIEKYITQSLVSAIFQHQTSRELEPQLHSHAIVLNITQGKDGDWRSVSSESLYRIQRELDLIYKTELEAKLNQMGYQTQKNEHGFEIKSIPKKIIDLFSTRSKQVELELKKYNLSRKDSTVKQRQIANLQTRKAKPAKQNLDKLKAHWQEQTQQQNWQFSISSAQNKIIHNPLNQALSQRVLHSINVLTEKDSVISEYAIYRHLNASDQKPISKDQLSSILRQFKYAGKIHSQTLKNFDRNTKLITKKTAIITQKGIELEQSMLTTAQKMNSLQPPSWLGKISLTLEKLAINSGFLKGNAIVSIKSAIKQIDTKIALASEKGHIWTQEQRAAAIGILSHQGKFSQLQGFAGTAKTSSILSSIRDIAKQEGYQVIAIAPSHAASQQLQKDIQADKQLTTSGYLAQMQNGQLSKMLHHNKVLIIHDEAGLASTQQMNSLLQLAEHAGHTLLNSGDRYQKASIGAGSAFGQLADNQVPTYLLSHLFRQKEAALKQAVIHSLPHDPNIKKALTILKNNGQIKEIKNRDNRIQSIAQQYSELSKKAKQTTLVLDPTRAGVDDLNKAIRKQLQQKGELPKDYVLLQVLKNRDIAQADLKHGAIGSVYQIKDIITLNSQALKQADKALQKGSQWKILKLYKDQNTLKIQSLKDPNKMRWINAKQLAKSNPSIADLKNKEFSIGDHVKFTASDIKNKTLTNQAVIITDIDPSSQQITLQKQDETSVTLNTTQPLNIDYNYAQTTFSSQGLTAKNVIYHAQSHNTNLINQRDFYVALSRAISSVTLITDSKQEIQNLIEKSTGEKDTALSTNNKALKNNNTTHQNITKNANISKDR